MPDITFRTEQWKSDFNLVHFGWPLRGHQMRVEWFADVSVE